MGTPAIAAYAPLRNALINVPPRIEAALNASNTLSQNVVVQITWKDAGTDKNVFTGWTGVSCRKTAPAVGQRKGDAVGMFEIDPVFATNVGLREGTRVQLTVHQDPAVAHTIHVEPLTASDWEIMELHSNFLELNLISQIRAITMAHPITIYLSPTSTAIINVTQVEPPLGDATRRPFAILSPQAEVIVAPKLRRPVQAEPTTEGAFDLTGAKNSVASTAKSKKSRRKAPDPSIVLRTICLPHPLFEDEVSDSLAIYVNPFIKASPVFSGGLAKISILPSPSKPIQAPDKDKEKETAANDAEFTVAKELVVKVQVWEDGPDDHVGISPRLAWTLGITELGDLSRYHLPRLYSRRITPSGPPIKKTPSKLVFHPFSISTSEKSNSMKIGGDKARQKEEAAAKEKETSTALHQSLKHIFDSPISEGMRVKTDSGHAGILSFAGHQGDWFTPRSPDDYTISLGKEIPDPTPAPPPPTISPHKVVSIDKLLDKAEKTLRRNGSVLICGGRGAGKTAALTTLSTRMATHLLHTVRTTCGSIADSSLSTIKDTLQKWFAEATFHAPSLLLLDDLERLLPAELEHADSTRSRQIAEIFLHIARPALYRQPIVLLASAPAPEALHSVLTNGFVFRETVSLKAPDKEARRTILESSWTGVDEECDGLEVAGMTDGYLPGDLHALVERARQEAIVRCMRTMELEGDEGGEIRLQLGDFESAVRGYVPASLRGVKLQKSTVDWNDIGGLDATKRILLETLEWPIKYAPIFQHSKLRLRSGLLLYGYPGCGKTLLASAVAAQFGMNFISVKGPELLNKYIGASEQSVRELFERAQSARPCVLFFDEFESIAPKRGHDSTGVTDRVVNQMLTQLDGAEGLEGVYVLAATSRPDLVDPALLRPGRLDKSLLCDIPTFDERVSILHALSRKLEIGGDVDLQELAERTSNYTGADLQAMLYNAHLEAVHEVISTENERPVNGDDIGPQRSFKKFKLGKVNIANGSQRETLADRARTKAKLDALLGDDTRKGPTDTEVVAPHVIIRQLNIENSLASTKPSISTMERNRLAGIYYKFQHGRSGEMPNGMAPEAISSRTSLM